MSRQVTPTFVYEMIKEFVSDLSNICSTDTPTKITLAGISLFIENTGPSDVVITPLRNFILRNKTDISSHDEAIFINFDAKTGPIRQLLNLISSAWVNLEAGDREAIWEWLEYFCEIIDKETTSQ